MMAPLQNLLAQASEAAVHPYGALSLVPPLVAIGLAIITRRPVVSLLVGIFCGALVTSHWNPMVALAATCEVHLWPTLIDPGKMRVFAFTLLMAGMIGVIGACGGMHGLIALFEPLARTRRGGQVTTWILGLLVFFDDYANTILLGSTLRPLCDRLKISREKLAYLVDSTAAPIASLALLSTWIAVEVDYIGEGIGGIDGETGLAPMELFIASIPYRFYAVMALVFILMIALTGRDFGPMLRRERSCLAGETTEEQDDPESDPIVTVPAERSRWFNAAAPILLTLAVVVWLLYTTGKASLGPTASGQTPPLRDILGSADSSLALQYGALAGLVLVAILSWMQRLLSGSEILMATGRGMRVVLPAIAILWCASALSRMTGSKSVDGAKSEQAYEYQDHRLYTGDYLTGKIIPAGGGADATDEARLIKLLPTIIFGLAAFLAFATGTSFGTMGLLMPMTITLTYSLLQAQGGSVSPSDPILLACVAGVLSGAVFGDHCSPISDTTILSSQACGCDHIAHVVTQMPYAISVGVVTVLLGTLPVGWGISAWWLLPVQAVALLLLLRLLGKKVSLPDTAQGD